MADPEEGDAVPCVYMLLCVPPPPPMSTHVYLACTLPRHLSFSEPLGIMTWTAQAAHCSMRNSLLCGGLPSYESFLSIWIKFVALMCIWEPLQRYFEVFSQFHVALASVQSKGTLIVTKIVYTPSPEEDEARAAKRQKKVDKKAVLARPVQEKIQQLIHNGYTIVYTDGSAKWEPGVGWIAGYGCHEPGGWETSSYLPPQSRQSVNTTELQAIIDTTTHYALLPMKTAVAMDSVYVHNGLQGAALVWQSKHWVTTQGPIINVDLWMEILALLESLVATYLWVKVPSHVDIARNDRANQSAEEGRLSSPLYLTIKHPVPTPCTPPHISCNQGRGEAPSNTCNWDRNQPTYALR